MMGIELPEHFEGRIIFMSMYDDMDWIAKGRSFFVCRKVSRGSLDLLRPWKRRKNGTGRTRTTPDGAWNPTAKMMPNFAKSGHLVLRGTSPFEKRSIE